MLIKEWIYTYKYRGGEEYDERIWNRKTISNKNRYEELVNKQFNNNNSYKFYL